MSFREDAFAITAKGIIDNLEKRNMEGLYFADSKAAVNYILSIMPNGSSVAWGGSMSVIESGLMEAIQNGDYELIDRSKAANVEEARQIFAKTSLSDYYLMSTNAITLNGELINIDGNGNRVASLIHGPAHVIIIAGMNKVVADVESGYHRIKTMACPPNAVRLNRNIPCGITGKCADCLSQDCFCNQIVVTRRSGHAGRIKVILVGENLGY